MMLSLLGWSMWTGCAADPCSIGGAPTSIDGLVVHLEALPEPIDPVCLVRSLERPLQLEATSNSGSAQPAAGEERPRLFLTSGALTLSLGTVGYGLERVEFSEDLGEGFTRKGELVFPITAPIDGAAMYDHLLLEEGEGSTCQVCHPQETIHPEGGFVSVGLRTDDRFAVSLDALGQVAADCNRPGPECDLLRAVFEDEVVHQPLSTEWATLDELE